MLAKVVVNARQVGMGEIGQYERFVFKGGGGLGQFAGTESVLAHFLDGHQSVAEQRILRLVDGPEAAGPDLADDAIARVEQVGGGKKTTPGFSQHGGVGSVHREQR